jgi:putative peptide zinc metalloprotease protein
MKLVVKAELARHPFRGDSVRPVALCEVPDGTERPRRYVVPVKLLELLSTCDRPLERDEAVPLMAERSAGEYTKDQLDRLVDEFLVPRKLLIDADAPRDRVVAAPRLDRYLFFKIRFLKENAVRPVADALQWLFHPSAYRFLISLIVVTHVWFYAVLMREHVPQLNAMSNENAFWVLLLFSFSGIIHEFGHAAALTRFGGKGAEIGFAFYICFAALFVDLSDAWKLARRERVIVDLSGMYFQSILLVFAAACYASTGWAVLAYCFVFTDIQIAANLNPLLRLDGYWAIADGLGIANLRSRSLRYLLLPIRKRTRGATALEMSLRTLRILRVYLVLAIIFFVYLIYAIGSQCFALLHEYPGMLRHAVDSWAASSWSNALSLSLGVLWRGVLLLGVAFAIFRALVWITNCIGPSSWYRRSSKELSIS